MEVVFFNLCIIISVINFAQRMTGSLLFFNLLTWASYSDTECVLLGSI